MENQYYPFVNTPLPYDYGALEPFIDEKTMHLHHDKHLETYINNLNKALEKNAWLQPFSLEELLYYLNMIPGDLSEEIRRNAGGVYNHRFYFEGMSDEENSVPEGFIKKEIDTTFGNFANFQKKFKDAALSVFGSGYAWLVESEMGLHIITTKNQDTPIELGLYPIINIDVWEHAYYLKNYNDRAAYIDNWFLVADWKKAEENLMAMYL